MTYAPLWCDVLDPTDVVLYDLDPGDPRLERDVLPVLRELRSHLSSHDLAAVYANGYPQGLRFLAAYSGTDCAGVASWRLVNDTFAIKRLYVEDLVTTIPWRRQGVAHALLAEMTSRAQALGCLVLDLDSGVQLTDAHRFYMREGLAITAFHFSRRFDDAPQTALSPDG